MIEFDLVRDGTDVEQILELQKVNDRSAVDDETGKSQGYTTVRHDYAVLSDMNQRFPSVVARAEGRVVGYCLMMAQEFRERINVLRPMFGLIDRLAWKGQPLVGNSRWFVMGQVCVADGYRAIGVFDGMYGKLRECYSADFDLTITEVSRANPRSLRAHRRVGFDTLHAYEDPAADENWELLLWDWR